MKTIFKWVPLLLALSACSEERVYGSAQAWQRNQCGRLPDKAEFDRCMSKTNTGYDSYKKQSDPEKK